MNELLIVKLWALVDTFDARLTLELKALDLTVSTFRLIGEVMSEPDGIRQNELARRLRVRAPTISAAVSRLEERGLVMREQDPDDPRAWRIKLKPDAPLQPGADLLGRMDQELTSTLDASERDLLLQSIAMLTERLQAPKESL
ncbi:MAG: MarR family transcriptional regulator [Deltaproteobacteria bacterium]|nr:MarR family transcriptional regulator [Deltaproteobacteria bacterium]